MSLFYVHVGKCDIGDTDEVAVIVRADSAELYNTGPFQCSVWFTFIGMLDPWHKCIIIICMQEGIVRNQSLLNEGFKQWKQLIDIFDKITNIIDIIHPDFIVVLIINIQYLSLPLNKNKYLLVILNSIQ